ncbi:MAG: ATP-binding protein [Deltaproteobacteria bacterium]|nr:ATP-binding protein [Deltaproteobacteria bacterium]
MLRYHMVVVTSDPALKRAVRRLTTASGSTATFANNSAALKPSDRHVDLAIFDARDDDPSDKFLNTVPADSRIIYIISDRLPTRVHLLEDPRVASLFFHDQRFDDDEFICAATKCLRDELFGLQKYFPWGVTTYTMTVRNYEQKTRAIDILMAYAKVAGVRGSVRDRIQLVVDELIMNAMYHAPVDEHGKERYKNVTLKELAQVDSLEPVQIQYGCSGRYFGVAIRDAGGSLTRARALEYLGRADRQTEIESKAGGAGLGLLSVLSSVSKLVFNLDPGYSTEVIGLFDMELFAKGQVGARSLHLHVADPGEDGELDDRMQRAAAITRAQPISGMWMLAALLSVIVVGLATAYYSRAPEQAANQSGATITVVPSPADAQVKINDKPVQVGSRIALSPKRQSHQVEVTRKGYQPWSETLSSDEIEANFRLHVTLIPAEN